MCELYDRDSDVQLAEAHLADASEQGVRNEFQIVNGYRKMRAAWHNTTTFVLKQKNESRLIRIIGFPASKEDMGRFTYVNQETGADLLP